MDILKRNFIPSKIKEDYSKIAWIYDAWSLFTESKAAKKVLEFSGIKGKENILVVAIGTGTLFEKILSRNKNGYIYGIDISPSMLEYAEAKLKNKNYNNYNLKEGNAYKLEFEDNHFHLLVNNYMLDLLPEEDFSRIIGEFYRVLKPGGKIIISSMATGNKWNNKLWFRISKNFPGLMTNCRPVELKKYILECGFKNITSVYINQFTFPSEVIKAEKIN